MREYASRLVFRDREGKQQLHVVDRCLVRLHCTPSRCAVTHSSARASTEARRDLSKEHKEEGRSVRTASRQDWPGAQTRKMVNATSGSDTRQPAQPIRSELRHTLPRWIYGVLHCVDPCR
jgi:hypothetical protein